MNIFISGTCVVSVVKNYPGSKLLGTRVTDGNPSGGVAALSAM